VDQFHGAETDHFHSAASRWRRALPARAFRARSRAPVRRREALLVALRHARHHRVARRLDVPFQRVELLVELLRQLRLQLRLIVAQRVDLRLDLRAPGLNLLLRRLQLARHHHRDLADDPRHLEDELQPDEPELRLQLGGQGTTRREGSKDRGRARTFFEGIGRADPNGVVLGRLAANSDGSRTVTCTGEAIAPE